MSQYQAYSRVVLYKQSKILPDRNFKVDDIPTYLSTLTKVIISDYQYIKHSLIIDCKFDLSQTYLDYTQNNDFDYVAITNVVNNVDEKTVYYFIENKQWRSKNTVLCNLYMDTVNSFDGDYTISDKTKVLREHKDRWKWITGDDIRDRQTQDIEQSESHYEAPWYYLTFVIPSLYSKVDNYAYSVPYDYEEVVVPKLVNLNGIIYLTGTIRISDNDILPADFPIRITADFYFYGNVVPIIDEYSEGVTPVLYKQNEETINGDSMKWYLAYQNTQTIDSSHPISPVATYLYPSSQIGVTVVTDTNISVDVLTNTNDQILFAPNFNQSKITLTYDGESYSPHIWYKGNTMTYVCYFISKRGTSTSQAIYYLEYKLVNNEWVFDNWYLKYINRAQYGSWLLKSSLANVNVYKVNSNIQLGLTGNTFPSSLIQPNTTIAMSTTTDGVLSIDFANRSLTTYLKIIELPYCPISYTFDEVTNIYTFPSFVTISSFDEGTSGKRIKINNDGFKDGFNESSYSVTNPLAKLKGYDYNDFNPTLNDLRDDSHESKLLHSDYYRPKFVYDSFGYDFRLEEENIDLTSIVADVFSFTFKANSTPSGALLFKFNEEIKKLSFQDYDSILTVARNLDYPLYNSDYLNYLRVGYNYDIKAKQIAERSAVLSGALGVIGGIGSIVGGSASANPAFVVGGISSIATSVSNTINNLARSELSLQQKLDEKKQQTNSVMGADDLDLLNYYTNGNKAKICWYECTNKMKQAFADLFYYCGYATQEFKVPNVNTRSWFNYLQAELVISDSKNLGEEIIKDIISRYAIGITFLHNNSNTWDIDQVKENWEVTLI